MEQYPQRVLKCVIPMHSLDIREFANACFQAAQARLTGSTNAAQAPDVYKRAIMPKTTERGWGRLQNFVRRPTPRRL